MNKKVFVVYETNYEDKNIIAVFSTKEKMEKFRSENKMNFTYLHNEEVNFNE